MSFHHHLSGRHLILALLAFVLIPVLPAGAHSLICRSDPIIGLSNGLTLIVGANITGTLEDIKAVNYEVHVPQGVTQTSYESTPLWDKTKETYKLIADQAPGQYLVIVTLNDKLATDMVADTSVLSPTGDTLGYYSVPGSTKKPMTMSFSA